MSIKLSKLKSNSIRDFIYSIRGRKVCEVIKYFGKKEVIPGAKPIPLVSWKGSTDEEYFICTFYVGMVLFDINEREMRLGNDSNARVIAIASELNYLNGVSDGMWQFNEKVRKSQEYISSDRYENDLNNIRFSDISRILGWKYKSRKVKEQEQYV